MGSEQTLRGGWKPFSYQPHTPSTDSVMPFMAAGVYLEKSIVQAAFEYSLRENVTLCGFLGDECVTLKHTPEIQVRQLV